ncbi:MAG: hypothetical protein JST82_15460 [Bacteroidetes bacterium]|nr:hypothetical protein [Bacteroidota bacterium]
MNRVLKLIYPIILLIAGWLMQGIAWGTKGIPAHWGETILLSGMILFIWGMVVLIKRFINLFRS